MSIFLLYWLPENGIRYHTPDIGIVATLRLRSAVASLASRCLSEMWPLPLSKKSAFAPPVVTIGREASGFWPVGLNENAWAAV